MIGGTVLVCDERVVRTLQQFVESSIALARSIPILWYKQRLIRHTERIRTHVRTHSHSHTHSHTWTINIHIRRSLGTYIVRAIEWFECIMLLSEFSFHTTISVIFRALIVYRPALYRILLMHREREIMVLDKKYLNE